MRPRLLDLFCGGGGAAVGYVWAGFDVTGVDIVPQPYYPFAFVRDDALPYLVEHAREYDAIHASPPCQRYAAVTRWRGDARTHDDLVPATARLLDAMGVPYAIENVLEAPIRADVILCGTMFGLRIKRHRKFQTTLGPLTPPAACQHTNVYPFMHKHERRYADAMGCGWMSARVARESIPPVYTRWIGRQLITKLS